MLADRRTRWVETPRQLASVIYEQLAELEKDLQGSPPIAPFLWDEFADESPDELPARRPRGAKAKKHNRPKDEEALSDFVSVFLRTRLQGRGIVFNREVQIRRGEKTDIHVEAISLSPRLGEAQVVRVVVEVKGCWNDGLKTDIEKQLVNRYLVTAKDAAGIYLVGWYRCARWNDPKDKSRVQTHPHMVYRAGSRLL